MILTIISEIVFFSIILLTGYIFNKHPQRNFYVLLTVFSLFVKLIYLYSTEYNMANLYDIDAHIEYIRYIINNASLPLPTACFECYQQPLYYLTATPIYLFFKNLGFIETDIFRILQLYSLLLFSLFTIFGLLIINKIMGTNLKSKVATSLLIFWPSGVFHSVRIGNDVLIYFLTTISLYYLIYYWKKRSFSTLIQSSIWAAISLLTKTNGLVIVFTLIFSFCIGFYKRKMKKFEVKQIISFLPILFIFICVIIFNQRNTLLGIKQEHWLGFNVVKDQNAYVGNTPINYLWFDLRAYFTYPNIEPRSDRGGRQYFWNYLFKTSLLGEFPISNSIQRKLAIVLSSLLLPLLIGSLIRFILIVIKRKKEYLPLVIYTFLSILSILILKISFSCSCSNDFRYIYPIVIPVVIFLSQSLDLIKNKGIRLVFIFTILAFPVISALYYLVPWLSKVNW